MGSTQRPQWRALYSLLLGPLLQTACAPVMSPSLRSPLPRSPSCRLPNTRAQKPLRPPVSTPPCPMTSPVPVTPRLIFSQNPRAEVPLQAQLCSHLHPPAPLSPGFPFCKKEILAPSCPGLQSRIPPDPPCPPTPHQTPGHHRLSRARPSPSHHAHCGSDGGPALKWGAQPSRGPEFISDNSPLTASSSKGSLATGPHGFSH